MTPKERILAAMQCKPTDYVPCVPEMNFQPEDQRWGKRWQYPFGPSIREKLDYMMNVMGVDQIVYFTIGAYPDSDVSSKVWIEGDVIHKVFQTPSGQLHGSIRYDEHWIFGFDVPFFNDYNPSHFVDPWIKSMQDVECLRHILKPPSKREDLERLRFDFGCTKNLADKYHTALCLYQGMGLTGAVNMFGPSQITMFCLENPDLVDAYMEVEHQWNLKCMEIGIDLGADIVRRNGFYESCDLFSPAILERFVKQRIKAEAQLTHSAGRLFSYTMLSGYVPLVEYFNSLDIDSLVCVDIFLREGDGNLLKRKLSKNISVWSGPSDTVHLPYENPEKVRKAVRDVFECFGKTGLLLTPCSSSKATFPWANVEAMIDEWKKLR